MSFSSGLIDGDFIVFRVTIGTSVAFFTAITVIVGHFGSDLQSEEVSTERCGDMMHECYTIGTVLDARQRTGAASRVASLALVRQCQSPPSWTMP
jgi:hypothetical protein